MMYEEYYYTQDCESYRFIQIYVPEARRTTLHRKKTKLRKNYRKKKKIVLKPGIQYAEVIGCQSCRAKKGHTTIFLNWCAEKIERLLNINGPYKPSGVRKGCPFCLSPRVAEIRRFSF